MPYPDNYSTEAANRWWGDDTPIVEKEAEIWCDLRGDKKACYDLAYDYVADPYQAVADMLSAHADGKPLSPILNAIAQSKAEHLVEKSDE